MYIYNFVWANYSARQLIAFEIWHIALGKNTLQAIRTFDMDIGVPLCLPRLHDRAAKSTYSHYRRLVDALECTERVQYHKSSNPNWANR